MRKSSGTLIEPEEGQKSSKLKGEKRKGESDNTKNKELLADIAYEFINLNKDLNVETLINALNNKKINNKTKQKILLLLGIPSDENIDKIIRLPEVKEMIKEKIKQMKEEINNFSKSEEFDDLLLKKYLKELEKDIKPLKVEKESNKIGIKYSKINYSPSKKFDIKETIKSFINKENKFYSKLNKDYKKEKTVFLLDVSSSMLGKKIEALKKFMLYYWLKNEKKQSLIKIFGFNVNLVEFRIINDLIKEKARGKTNIAKALKKLTKKDINNSIIYLITDNIPTVGDEEEILKAVEEIKSKKNKLIIILLQPTKDSINLSKKMTDRVLVLEGNYLRELMDYIN